MAIKRHVGGSGGGTGGITGDSVIAVAGCRAVLLVGAQSWCRAREGRWR